HRFIANHLPALFRFVAARARRLGMFSGQRKTAPIVIKRDIRKRGRLVAAVAGIRAASLCELSFVDVFVTAETQLRSLRRHEEREAESFWSPSAGELFLRGRWNFRLQPFVDGVAAAAARRPMRAFERKLGLRVLAELEFRRDEAIDGMAAFTRAF